jgi:hypothetical protein
MTIYHSDYIRQMIPLDFKKGEFFVELLPRRPTPRHPSHRAYRHEGEWIETYVGWWRDGGVLLRHEGRERPETLLRESATRVV